MRCATSIDMACSSAPDAAMVRLVYIGNMSLSYDLATVVDAVKGDEGLSLDLAGAGPDEAELRGLAEGCGRIRFHGYLGDEELRLLQEPGAGAVRQHFVDRPAGGGGLVLRDVRAGAFQPEPALFGDREGLVLRPDPAVGEARRKGEEGDGDAEGGEAHTGQNIPIYF